MSEIVSLPVQVRTGKGTRAASKVRKSGQIPGIVYGQGVEPVLVALPYKELDHAIRVQHARTLTITLDSKPQTVLIRELQWDYLGKQMIHIDLWRIEESKRVKVVVPVELRGVPKTSGGAVLDQPFHQLHIECLARSIPDSIRVDISGLVLGVPIHVSDLKLPEGVKVLEGGENVVVQLKLPGQEPAASGEPGAAEPEVLTAKKPKEGEEE